MPIIVLRAHKQAHTEPSKRKIPGIDRKIKKKINFSLDLKFSFVYTSKSKVLHQMIAPESAVIDNKIAWVAETKKKPVAG